MKIIFVKDFGMFEFSWQEPFILLEFGDKVLKSVIHALNAFEFGKVLHSELLLPSRIVLGHRWVSAGISALSFSQEPSLLVFHLLFTLLN